MVRFDCSNYLLGLLATEGVLGRIEEKERKGPPTATVKHLRIVAIAGTRVRDGRRKGRRKIGKGRMKVRIWRRDERRNKDARK